MNRRHFLVSAAAAGASTLCANTMSFTSGSTGKLLVTLQIGGGWDVAGFCDPKVNITGEKPIHLWAGANEIGDSGNLQYAVYGHNQTFFEKYYRDIMIVNGVDYKTNAHPVGVMNSWSGLASLNYPSITALHGAMYGQGLPLAYLNCGGFSQTADLVRYARLNDIEIFKKLLQPNTEITGKALLARGDADLVQNYQRLRSARLGADRPLSEVASYQQVKDDADGLKRYSEVLRSESVLQGIAAIKNSASSNLLAQMQMVLLAFKAEVSCASDLYIDGFDTHADHDDISASRLGFVTDAIDYFWTYAETLGLADRILLMVGSDFSRTPFYNLGAGKDHWPIGSVIFMERNASWGNRVVGATDERLNVKTVDASSLQAVQTGGIVIEPGHIHNALRSYLGHDRSPIIDRFPLPQPDNLPLFR